MVELSNIVKNFKTPKVLVVGDLMLDEYISGEANRISPEAPILILDAKETTYLPGGAANTAHNIKTLGDEVILTGVIGQDEKGRILKEALEKKGIDSQGLIIDPQRKTTLKTRVVARNQQVVRVDIENRDPIGLQTEESLFNFIQSKIGEISSIIISDYAKGVVTPTLSQKIIALARNNNILCLIDPKGNDYSKYRNCHIITPNKKEIAQALNIPIEQMSDKSKFLQAGKMLLGHVMSDYVLVTQGAEGMTLFGKDGNVFYYQAVNKKAIDVSGAGDTSIGTFALALGAGADLKQAVILASHACGVEVSKVGTAVVFPEELEESLRDLTYEEKQD